MCPSIVSNLMHVKSDDSEPSNPPHTCVPSGGLGSHSTGVRLVPLARLQPRASATHQPVPEEPLRLRRVRLSQLPRLSVDAVQVDVLRAPVHVLEDAAPIPLRTERQRRPVTVTQRLVRVPRSEEHTSELQSRENL